METVGYPACKHGTLKTSVLVVTDGPRRGNKSKRSTFKPRCKEAGFKQAACKSAHAQQSTNGNGQSPSCADRPSRQPAAPLRPGWEHTDLTLREALNRKSRTRGTDLSFRSFSDERSTRPTTSYRPRLHLLAAFWVNAETRSW